jgi:hypothetical protein
MTMSILCPNCKSKAFSIFQKEKALNGKILCCKHCGKRMGASSLLGLFINILSATLWSTVFVISMMWLNILFLLGVAVVLAGGLYFIAVYFVPLDVLDD